MAGKLGRPQRQDGTSIGHKVRQELLLGHVWSLQKELREHRHDPWKGLQEVPSVACSI